jgi:hypothetical protein
MGQRIVVTAKQRSNIDVEKLAMALLDVVNSLTPKEQEELEKKGDLVLADIKGGVRSNRSRKRSVA